MEVGKQIFVGKTPPCTNGCPAGIDVRGFIRLIKDRRFKEALSLITEKPSQVFAGGFVTIPARRNVN